ncbi:hypothetical protein [Polymorphospora lycopeni]|uniref:Uncharacterized protein n=1 Tax=Polymorphospora lycopeni TaxID=3140240 RepID=A0ABV5CKP9_9ACTN
MDYRDRRHDGRPDHAWAGPDDQAVGHPGDDRSRLPATGTDRSPLPGPVPRQGGRHHRAEERDDTDERPADRHGAGPTWQQTETTTSWQRVTQTRDWRETTSTYDWSMTADDAYGGNWRHDEPVSRGRRRRERIDWSTSTETGEWSRHDHTGQFDRVTGADGDPAGRSDRWGAGGYPHPPTPAPDDTSGWSMSAGRSRGSAEAGPGETPYGDEGRRHGPERGRHGQPANGRERTAETGQWSSYTDTGQWDRMTDTGSWAPRSDGEPPYGSGAGRSEPSDRYGSAPDRADTDGRSRRARHHRDDEFWAGTRLAEDDPRWVETPPTAPRSPAVSFPGPGRSDEIPPDGSHPASTIPSQPRTRRAATAGAPGRATATRTAPTRRPATRDDGLLDPDPGGAVASVLYTAAWYAVPLLFLFVWMLTLDSTAPAGCVTDAAGGGCGSPRANAVNSMLDGAPRFGAALATSLAVAVLLRWASGTWRAVSVGLAAAVVGGGLSTVLLSAITGEPLG